MSTNGAKSFQIKQTVSSPLKYKVMTTLPLPEKVQGLKPLEEHSPALFKNIMRCLKQIYSYVTDRDYVENTVTFFHHACSTALYEKFYLHKIHQKDHGKKLGNIFSLIKNTIDEIETALKKRKLSEHHDLLQDFHAELIWHYNIFVNVIPTLSDEVKTHLKEHSNIDAQTLKPIFTSPRKRTRVLNMHPGTPPAEKMIPFSDRKSPKKMSLMDRLTEHLIRNNGEMVKPVAQVQKPIPVYSENAMLLMLPRVIRIKRQPLVTANKAVDSELNIKNESNAVNNQLSPQ